MPALVADDGEELLVRVVIDERRVDHDERLVVRAVGRGVQRRVVDDVDRGRARCASVVGALLGDLVDARELAVAHLHRVAEELVSPDLLEQPHGRWPPPARRASSARTPPASAGRRCRRTRGPSSPARLRRAPRFFSTKLSKSSCGALAMRRGPRSRYGVSKERKHVRLVPQTRGGALPCLSGPCSAASPSPNARPQKWKPSIFYAAAHEVGLRRWRLQRHGEGGDARRRHDADACDGPGRPGGPAEAPALGLGARRVQVHAGRQQRHRHERRGGQCSASQRVSWMASGRRSRGAPASPCTAPPSRRRGSRRPRALKVRARARRCACRVQVHRGAVGHRDPAREDGLPIGHEDNLVATRRGLRRGEAHGREGAPVDDHLACASAGR